MKRRFLSMLLCLTMLIGILPTGVSADGDVLETEPPASAVQTAEDDTSAPSDDNAEAEAAADGAATLHGDIEEERTEVTLSGVSTNNENTYETLAAANDSTCSHDNVETDSKGNVSSCADCGVDMVVKIENGGAVTYGTDINDAIANAADGSTLTVLSAPLSIRENLYLPADTEFTVDLNGKTLMGRQLRINNATSSLKIIDTKGGGSISFYVWDGNVEFRPNDNSTTIGDIAVYGGSVKLYGGNISANNWQFDDDGKINLTHLLPEGYAYRLYQPIGGSFLSWVKQADLRGKNVRLNFPLAIVECTHPEATAENKCEYCGTDVAVKVTKGGEDSYFTKLDQSAVDAANGGTLTLLSDLSRGEYIITEQIAIADSTLTLDLNDYTICGSIVGKKAIFNIGENANVTVKDGGINKAGLIALNPVFEINGGSLTIDGGEFNSLGSADTVLKAVSGSLIINGGVFNRIVQINTSKDNNGSAPKVNAKISGGTFRDTLYVMGTSPASLLADGYAFASIADGTLVDGYTIENDGITLLNKVTVTPHTVHSFDFATGKCGCGFACTHEHTDISNWKCTDCGKQAIARVTDWQDGNAKLYFDIKKAVSSAAQGEYIKVLLPDGVYTFAEDIPVYGNVNLYFLSGSASNSIDFDSEHSFVVEPNGALFIGASTHIGAVRVKANGAFGEEGTSTVDHLMLEENCALFTNGRLQSGNFGKITVPSGHSVKDVVMKSDSRELSFKHTDGKWASKDELEANEICDVAIAALPFSYPELDIKLDGYEWMSAVYNGNNKLSLGITVKDGSIQSYEWVIDYYASGSESVTDTKTLTEASPEYKLDKVGTYKVRCTITSDGYSKELTGGDISIIKGTAYCIEAPQPADDLMFGNGEQKLLKTAGTAFGGTMYYSLDGENWSEDIPTASEAKTYTVYYKVVGDENYNNSTVESVEATINPFVYETITAFIEKNYDGTVNLPDDIKVYGNNSENAIYLMKGVDYTITGGTYASANAGDDIDVTLKIKLIDPRYVFKDGDGTTDEKEFAVKGKINKIDAPDALGSLEIVRGEQRDYKLSLNTVLGALGEGRTYGTVEYSNLSVDIPDYYNYDGEASITDGELTIPIRNNKTGSTGVVGIVTVKVNSTNYAEFTMTVNIVAVDKIYPVIKPQFSKYELTYGEALGSIAISGSEGDDTSKIDGTLNWATPDYIPNVGQYSASWVFTPNDYKYDVARGSITITVNKADSTYIAPTANALTYNGSEQELLTAGSTSDGTMEYRLDSSAWSMAIPKAENAGEYVVYYRVKGDDNHKDSGEKQIIVTIAKAANGIENLAISGWTYGDEPNLPTSTAKYGTPKYSYSTAKDGTYGAAVPHDAGTYWVKATADGSGNYSEAASEPISFEIARKSVEGAAVGTFENMTYNGRAQTPQAEVVIDGLKATGTWSAVTNINDTTDFAANGNFIGTISGKTTGMAKKSIENAVIAPVNTLTYNGGEQTQDITVTLDDLTVTYDVSGNKATTVKTDGSYTLTVTGSGNFEGTKDFEWNISPARPIENDLKKTTATVRRGGTLAEAAVTNGELFALDGTTVLDGTFAWVDDTKVVNSDGTEQMKFTPDDKNYSEITLDIAVSTYSTGGGGSSFSSYTVKFDTDGGSKVASVKVSKNGTVKKPTAPSKDGFEFAGWFTDKTLKNEYDFNTKVTKSFTLYAAWNKIEEGTNLSDKPTEPEKEKSFDDVSDDDWYYDDVIKAVENGLFNGTNDKTFEPNSSITRGMFVTVLYRAEGEPEVNKSIPFADVFLNDYYANAVIWAEQNEIVNGVSENEFAPNDNITREQIAAMMFRYAKYKGYDVSQGGMQIREFADFESISDYAVSAMAWSVNTGLMKGKTQTAINPQDNATRAEIAAILNRFADINK